MKTNKGIAITLLVLLTSCNNSNNSYFISQSSSNNSSSFSSASSSEYISSVFSSSSTSSSITNPIEQKLDAPSLVIDEVTGIVTWSAIDNATHYNYIINDADVQTTTSTTIVLEDKSNVSVQAANSNVVSRYSSAVTYYDTSDIYVGEKEYINVYFHNTNYDSITISQGLTIDKPNNPSKTNYTFDNWYIDPYYTTLFDFSTPLYESTIIYANYIPNELIDNTYFWIKANDKISAASTSSDTSSNWHFIPLKLNENQTSFKEFTMTVTVSGASSADPAYFLIMDGFDDYSGRTYWKYDNKDFLITNDGTYNIYFSLETEYLLNNVVCHVYIEETNNTAYLYSEESVVNKLKTPVVNINYDNELAIWDEIDDAIQYEVVIDNKTPQLIEVNYISINKYSTISVRAINSNNETSNWSIPAAYLNYIVNNETPSEVYVYFADSNLSAIKLNYGESVDYITPEDKDNWTFEGWYLDIAYANEVTFPYVVTQNTVLYAKYTYEIDYEGKEYYKLIDSNGNTICGLTWNTENYSFYEYKTPSISLESDNTYYVTTLDETKSWGPYKVTTSGTYIIYFSEEYVWDIGTENAQNVYFHQLSYKIYFSNNYYWDGTIKAYIWDSTTGSWLKAWPGTTMTYAKTNSYGQSIYYIEVDVTIYDSIIFTNGSKQTIDISLSDAYDGIGYYLNGESSGKYTVGTYKFS